MVMMLVMLLVLRLLHMSLTLSLGRLHKVHHTLRQSTVVRVLATGSRRNGSTSGVRLVLIVCLEPLLETGSSTAPFAVVVAPTIVVVLATAADKVTALKVVALQKKMKTEEEIKLESQN